MRAKTSRFYERFELPWEHTHSLAKARAALTARRWPARRRQLRDMLRSEIPTLQGANGVVNKRGFTLRTKSTWARAKHELGLAEFVSSTQNVLRFKHFTGSRKKTSSPYWYCSGSSRTPLVTTVSTGRDCKVVPQAIIACPSVRPSVGHKSFGLRDIC